MNNKNNLIPKYRFPEFNDAGWEKEVVGEIVGNENSSLSINKLKILREGFKLFGADGLVGFIDSFKQDEDYIAVIKDGSGAGRLSYYPSKSSVVGTLTYLKVKNKKKNDVKFQFYNLHNIDFKNHIKGGGIPHIYYSDYKNDFIGNPNNLAEQHKIAACLSSLDKVIAGHEEKLTALEEHKKGLMQNLFPQEDETMPKFRFSEFVNDGDWVEKKLNEISLAIFDGTHQTPKYIEQGVPFYSVENIVSGNKNKFISEEDYLFATRLNKPEKGDILLTRIGNIGFSKLVDWNFNFSIYVTLACIKVKENIVSGFLHCYFQSPKYQKEILSKSLLDAAPCKINMNELRNTNIMLPNTIKEQQKIAEVLSSVDDLIVAQREKIDALKEHKKGLLQGLFPKMKS